jgi:uncharacterized protein YgiM (DUF1202 family)
MRNWASKRIAGYARFACEQNAKCLVDCEKGSPVMISGWVRALVVGALLLAVGVSLGPRSVSAADFEKNDIAVVATDLLNVRSDAGLDGRIVTTFGNGLRLLILDGPRDADGYTWYKVQGIGDSDEDPLVGWVASDFIAAEGAEDNFASARWVVVSDGPVNVRMGAGTSRSIVTTMAEGETASVIGRTGLSDANGYTWINLLLNDGSSGWVATDFLSILTADPGDGGNEGGFDGAEGVEVIDGPLNVRNTPSLTGSIGHTVQTGFKFFIAIDSDLVEADGYTWVNITTFGAIHGWVATDFVSPIADMPCGDGACYPEELDPYFQVSAAIVTDGPVNLRASAGTSADILMTLEDGDYLWISKPVVDHVEEANGYTWIEVTAAGETGWVAIDFISPAE